MALIKIGITHNEIEWTLIENAMKEVSKNRTFLRGTKGYNEYITMELNRVLKTINIDSINKNKIRHIRKGFEINLPDAEADKMLRLCQVLDIRPGELISKLIIQPHFSNKSINETILLRRK